MIRSGKNTRLIKWAEENDVPIITSPEEFIELMKTYEPEEDKKVIVWMEGKDQNWDSYKKRFEQRRKEQEEFNRLLADMLEENRRRNWALIFY